MPLDRNFRLLFAGRSISYIGTYLAPIAVAFAVLDLGGGATAVGLSFAAWTLAQVSMLAFGGVVGDRLPRRKVMICSDVASATVRGLMGVLLVTGHAQVWHLIALQALGGASVAFYNPAFYRLVREIVPGGRPATREQPARGRAVCTVPDRGSTRRDDRGARRLRHGAAHRRRHVRGE